MRQIGMLATRAGTRGQVQVRLPSYDDMQRVVLDPPLSQFLMAQHRYVQFHSMLMLRLLCILVLVIVIIIASKVVRDGVWRVLIRTANLPIGEIEGVHGKRGKTRYATIALFVLQNLLHQSLITQSGGEGCVLLSTLCTGSLSPLLAKRLLQISVLNFWPI